VDVDVDVAGLSRADGLVVLGAGNAAGWLQEATRRLGAGGDDAAGGGREAEGLVWVQSVGLGAGNAAG